MVAKLESVPLHLWEQGPSALQAQSVGHDNAMQARRYDPLTARNGAYDSLGVGLHVDNLALPRLSEALIFPMRHDAELDLLAWFGYQVRQ
jgi:hypothetical protein